LKKIDWRQKDGVNPLYLKLPIAPNARHLYYAEEAGRLCQMNNQNKKYTLSRSAKDRISKQLAAYICKEFKDVVTVYLFGSFVKEGQFSDIDLGLLFNENVAEALNIELTLETQLEKQFGHTFDVRVLNDAPNSFAYNVVRMGQIIIDLDTNFRAGFEGKVLKKYFDFDYFRRRYLKEVGYAEI
jgi:predicted nucleotidyltransferase